MGKTANVKAIIVDLDRTLLHSDKTVSEYTVEVLCACREKGIMIVVATARPWRTAMQYCQRIACDKVVVSNGARVLYGGLQTDHGIRGESAVQVLQALTHHSDLRITVETGEVAYSNVPIADYETTLSDDLIGIAKTEGALKILVGLDREETLGIVVSALTEDLYYTVANGHLLQIMSRSATKWKGIQTVLERCQCDPKDAVYFGDDQDDLEPIRMCGLGVAVSNGIEEVKGTADYIAESNDDDGVAKWIAQMVL